jgi:hypothetical protein
MNHGDKADMQQTKRADMQQTKRADMQQTKRQPKPKSTAEMTLVNFHMVKADYAAYRRVAKAQTPPKTFSKFVREALAAKAKPLLLRDSLRALLREGVTVAILRLREENGGHMPCERLGVAEVAAENEDTVSGGHVVDVWQGVGARLFMPADDKGQPMTADGNERYYHHLIRQTEGTTREDAISSYADRLAGAIVENYPEDQHAATALDLLGQHHYYAIGYVNLRNWRSFPTEHELGVRWRATQTNLADVLPRDDDDLRFYEWAKDWLAERWQDRPAPDERGGIVLYPRQREDGISWGNMPFYPEPFKTEAENIEAWARAMMRAFQGYGTGEMLRFERYHEHVILGGFYVVPLVVRQ